MLSSTMYYLVGNRKRQNFYNVGNRKHQNGAGLLQGRQQKMSGWRRASATQDDVTNALPVEVTG